MTAQNAGAGIVLSSINSHVRRILDDVNLTQFFVIAPDEAAAVVLLNQSEKPGTASESAKREGKSRKQSGPTAAEV